MNKIKIGIVNTVNTEFNIGLLVQCFSSEEILELFTPIIYGNQWFIDRLKCKNSNLDFRITNETEIYRDTIRKALRDKEHGLLDTICLMPTSISDNDVIRVFVEELKYNDTVYGILSNDTLHIAEPILNTSWSLEHLNKLINILKRDFDINNPRIALLPSINTDQVTDKELSLFGPYTAEQLFSEKEIELFDCVVTSYKEEVEVALAPIQQDKTVRLISSLPVVVTSPVYNNVDDVNTINANILRQALYLGIDVYRNRVKWDYPFENPLGKLYLDKKEEVSAKKKREKFDTNITS